MTSEPLPTPQGLEKWATFREAMAQPRIWRQWTPRLAEHAASVSEWMRSRGHTEIWFCGAGTSAFIGETLAPYLNATPSGGRYRAIATTDMVSCPGNFVRTNERVLVVSFGRSGNSSETAGVLDLLDRHLPDADRLHFTCNADGLLATRPLEGRGEQRTVLLPDETNDSGFAMTSSYSTMLLSALACLDRTPPPSLKGAIDTLAERGQAILERSLECALANRRLPSRAIFLGCGALKGSAREAALKVLELTCGRIPTAWDSTLGFRHGPKAIVDDETRVYVFISSDGHTRRYDEDAANEIRRQFGSDAVVTLGADSGADLHVPTVYNDAWTSVLYVAAAQMQAIAWSNALQINVDSPFETGNLSRVVDGVKLYPYVTAQ